MSIRLPKKSSFKIEKEESGNVVLSSKPGTSLSRAAPEAISVAQANPSVSVSLMFNETEVTVKPNDKSADVEKRWEDEFNRKHEEWAASPEGKAEAALREEENRAYATKAKEAQARTKEIVSQSKFQFTNDMAEITGYGGKLEQRTRDSVTVGLDWLEKHPEKDITKPGDRKELEAVIDEHEPGHSGASSGAVMGHIQMATEKGWDN